MMETRSARHVVAMFVVRAGLGALVVWLTYRYIGLIPMLFAIVGAAVLVAKPIIEAGDTWISWAKTQPYEKWHGNYYEFAGTHIRIYPVGDTLWFAGADVMRVLGKKPDLMTESTFSANEYGPIPDTGLSGFSEAGVERLLRASDHYEARRMLLWIQREVIKPFRRKRELAQSRAGG
jgi:hypothetical protein